MTPEERSKEMKRRLKKWSPQARQAWNKGLKLGPKGNKQRKAAQKKAASDYVKKKQKSKAKQEKVVYRSQQSQDMANYWAKMTPKQRAKEVARRAALRAAHRTAKAPEQQPPTQAAAA